MVQLMPRTHIISDEKTGRIKFSVKKKACFSLGLPVDIMIEYKKIYIVSVCPPNPYNTNSTKRENEKTELYWKKADSSDVDYLIRLGEFNF